MVTSSQYVVNGVDVTNNSAFSGINSCMEQIKTITDPIEKLNALKACMSSSAASIIPSIGSGGSVGGTTIGGITIPTPTIPSIGGTGIGGTGIGGTVSNPNTTGSGGGLFDGLTTGDSILGIPKQYVMYGVALIVLIMVLKTIKR